VERRVVITGIGLVSPVGIGTGATWNALLAGTSGVGRVTKFDVANFAAQIAAEIRGFDPLQFVDKKDVKKMDVFIQYAIAASQFAMDDAGLAITPANATNVGVFIGSGIGGFSTIEREHETLLQSGPRRISPFFIPAMIINLAAGQVSIRFGAKGPNLATCTACSASAHAVGESYEIIRRGDADAMIAGGSEAAITPMSIGGFAALRALSTRNDEPHRASRPFDRDRDGFVIGEGAGIVVMEELESARRRGAKIYAEVAGYGATSDGMDMVQPSGEGAVRCMRMALEPVKAPVDYINPHATSTPIGDLREIEAIREVFGAKCPPIAATKSLTGHSLGAAGAQEAIYSLLMMNNGFICESANIEELDPAFADMPIVRERVDNASIGHVLSNSFGFGGTNATIVLKRLDA